MLMLIFKAVLSFAILVAFSPSTAESWPWIGDARFDQEGKLLVTQREQENGSHPAPLEQSYEIVAIEFSGLSHTDPDWLRSYIDLKLPAVLIREDALKLQRKLLTTALFSQVKVVFSKAAFPFRSDQYVMQVDVVERWTLIPVIRGAYGGGTPLRVVGIYDVHTLGRLLVVGAELQKYGNAPPGGVVYLKSPRHDAGRYVLAAEFWREFRRRPLYSEDGFSNQTAGVIGTNVAMSRLNFLMPFSEKKSWDSFRVGGELTWFFEKRPSFEWSSQEKKSLIPDIASQSFRLLPAFIYDDVDINLLDLDGLRLILKGGPSFVTLGQGEQQFQIHGFQEAELFWFKLFQNQWNLAFHGVMASSSFHSARNEVFLGGLDSLRGFPDSSIHGTHATWFNAELRHMSWKPTIYTWIQTLGFCDAGSAAFSWETLSESAHAACGIGARLAVPQVNRLMFRLDYAWAIDGSGQQGITAGMGQFFDPYRPLSER